MSSGISLKVAVVGAGVAGTACAEALARSGRSVQLFDKSRGPGGRLARRRVEWVDRQRHVRTTRLDGGAVAVTAHSGDFRAFIEHTLQAGRMAEWPPVAAIGGLPADDGGGALCLPVPDLPSLCRHLCGVGGVAASCAACRRGMRRVRNTRGARRRGRTLGTAVRRLTIRCFRSLSASAFTTAPRISP